MKDSIILFILILLGFVLGAQNAAFSENELKFMDGYKALLNGDPKKALEVFEYEIFKNKNYDAVPYYRTAACAVTEKEAPNHRKLYKASQKAKRAKNYWGASVNKKEFQKAHELIKTKAANGNAVAQYVLGKANYFGARTEKQPQQAFEYMNKAAEQGLICAQAFIGIFYAEGIGVEKDYSKAVELLEENIEINPRKSLTKYLKKLRKKMDKL